MTDRELEQLRKVRARARCLFTMEQVHAALDVQAMQLNQDYADRDPLLLTVMNGGVFIAGELLSRLDFPLQIDYLHATRYNNTTTGSELTWRVRPQSSLGGRHVLILDDILDVGATLEAIVDECHKAGAASVATVVLVDKQHDRKAREGLTADYTALYAEDAYLFGCGMDYKSYWRNAPGIFAVREQDI